MPGAVNVRYLHRSGHQAFEPIPDRGQRHPTAPVVTPPSTPTLTCTRWAVHVHSHKKPSWEARQFMLSCVTCSNRRWRADISHRWDMVMGVYFLTKPSHRTHKRWSIFCRHGRREIAYFLKWFHPHQIHIKVEPSSTSRVLASPKRKNASSKLPFGRFISTVFSPPTSNL